MPQSLAHNYVHIVFSTKHREPIIFAPFEEKLHAYIAGICKNLECTPIKIGGYDDHVHILCMLSRKIALMKLIEEVKVDSSKWMKTQSESLEHFYWQSGYAAFSVQSIQLDDIARYITNQYSHHDKNTFKDEYRLLLQSNGVEFDEQYMWD